MSGENAYEEMCTKTNKLLPHHLRHAHYVWRQQGRRATQACELELDTGFK